MNSDPAAHPASGEPHRSEAHRSEADRPGWLPTSTAERSVLCVLLGFGVALRIYGLTDHGLWIDEYGTWWTIAGPTWADGWSRALEIQGQSPLYYLVVRASVDLMGMSIAALRMPSLIFGIGLLALAYPLAMQMFRNSRVAVLAVAAFAVNERLIYYAQEARPYSLALFLAGCSVFFYLAVLDRGGIRNRVGFVLSGALTYYAHYFFGIVLLVQGLHWLTQRAKQRGGSSTGAWLLDGSALALLLIPGALQLSSLFARRESLDWIPAPAGWMESLEPAAELLDPTLLGLTAVAALATWALKRRSLKDALGRYGGLAVLWFVVPVVAFAIVPQLAGIHLAHARYLVAAAPAVPMLFATLMALPSGSAWIRAIPVAVFLIASVTLRIVPWLSEQGPFWWFYQHGWEQAGRDIAREYREGDVILYRTHFVELDEIVRGEASASTIEFVEWPILAHLPSHRTHRRLALPYSDSEPTRARLQEIVKRATEADRLWIVGLEVDDPTGERRVLSRAMQMAKLHGMNLTARTRHGLVHVIRMSSPNEHRSTDDR